MQAHTARQVTIRHVCLSRALLILIRGGVKQRMRFIDDSASGLLRALCTSTSSATHRRLKADISSTRSRMIRRSPPSSRFVLLRVRHSAQTWVVSVARLCRSSIDTQSSDSSQFVFASIQVVGIELARPRPRHLSVLMRVEK